MSERAQALLTAFECLAPEEKHEVTAELLRRVSAGGELPDSALDELADELFRSYDAEEALRATP